MMESLEEKYFVYQDDYMIAAVPPFARYAYEIWIIPKRQLAGPWQFTDQEYRSFSKALQKVVKGYDSFVGRRCPYIMGLHAAPNLDDTKFHFHVEFYPPLRSGDKPKILAVLIEIFFVGRTLFFVLSISLSDSDSNTLFITEDPVEERRVPRTV